MKNSTLNDKEKKLLEEIHTIANRLSVEIEFIKIVDGWQDRLKLICQCLDSCANQLILEHCAKTLNQLENK